MMKCSFHGKLVMAGTAEESTTLLHGFIQAVRYLPVHPSQPWKVLRLNHVTFALNQPCQYWNVISNKFVSQSFP